MPGSPGMHYPPRSWTKEEFRSRRNVKSVNGRRRILSLCLDAAVFAKKRAPAAAGAPGIFQLLAGIIFGYTQVIRSSV